MEDEQKNISPYYYRKMRGICVMCGKEEAQPNRTTCCECSLKALDREYTDEQREKMRGQSREAIKKKRTERKEKGLCACGSKLLDKRYKSCGRCRAEARDRYRRRTGLHEMTKRDQWRQDGKCYYCGGDVIEGKKVCEVHYEKALQRAEKCRENGGYKNWKKF